MSNDFDLLLVKSNQTSDTIDLCVGEAKALCEITRRYHNIDSISFSNQDKIWEYQPPTGYPPLARLLEEKHGAKVVITNGAKQALAASFFALHKAGHRKIGMRKPYWTLIPPLAQHLNLESVMVESDEQLADCDSYLFIGPNNPDGFMPELKWVKDINATMPVIHDGAYYTPAYVNEELTGIGDLQLFSISKMYGLSGLRLGYVVCRNEKYYKDLMWYLETTTVGASTVSQKILLDILLREKACPKLAECFYSDAQAELAAARAALRCVDPAVMTVLDGGYGMFAWVQLHDKSALERAKVKIIDGAAFGSPGMARINLGVGQAVIAEAVNRINSRVWG